MHKEATRIAPTAEPALVQSLHDLTRCLGGESSYFMVSLTDRLRITQHLFLNCDPRWGIEYEAGDCSASDPWLRYAATSSAPIRAADVRYLSEREQAVVNLADRFGLANAILLPAPSPHGRSRIALLAIGARETRLHERLESRSYRAAARDAAMALHEQWTEATRTRFVRSTELTTFDLELLQFELDGVGTKAIARAIGLTSRAVDSQVSARERQAGRHQPSFRRLARVGVRIDRRLGGQQPLEISH